MQIVCNANKKWYNHFIKFKFTTDEERAYMEKKMTELRSTYPEMIFVPFRGDEKSSGGCLAAGRGFFHINSHGGAESCPFSPYSDINVRDTSLREALRSELFRTLQSESILTDEHTGGCVLFEQKDEVEAIIERGGDISNTAQRIRELTCANVNEGKRLGGTVSKRS